MPEDLKQFIPKQMHDDAGKTWPGYLSQALDQLLYGSDTKGDRFTAPKKVYVCDRGPHKGHPYLESKRLLVSIRDYLEAVALGSVAGQNEKWFPEDKITWMEPK